jgi:hypothetical protein
MNHQVVSHHRDSIPNRTVDYGVYYAHKRVLEVSLKNSNNSLATRNGETVPLRDHLTRILEGPICDKGHHTIRGDNIDSRGLRIIGSARVRRHLRGSTFFFRRFMRCWFAARQNTILWRSPDLSAHDKERDDKSHRYQASGNYP